VILQNVFIVFSQRKIYIDTWHIVFTPYTLKFNKSKRSLIVVYGGGMGLMDLRKFSWIHELLQVAQVLFPLPIFLIYNCPVSPVSIWNIVLVVLWCHRMVVDALPLRDSNVSPKQKNSGRVRSRGTLPSSQHFGRVEGRARVPRCD
jgi:hypothetical protein